MKKLISMVLAVAMVAVLFAGCGASKPAETTPATSAPAETTAPAMEAPASALELLETVWRGYAEDEKFAVIGGSMAAPVDGAPGAWELTDENISYSLLIPAEQLPNVTEAASMIHMMNANTFTCAAFRLAEGVSAADFGAAMKDAVMNNQWMCGFPETLLIRDVAGQYVVMAFGAGDLLTAFTTHMSEAYPEAVTLVEEPIV